MFNPHALRMQGYYFFMENQVMKLKKFLVIQHDHIAKLSINTELGYFATTRLHDFRKIPISAQIKHGTVMAKNAKHAIAIFKEMNQ